jgi:hypothetical protein
MLQELKAISKSLHVFGVVDSNEFYSLVKHEQHLQVPSSPVHQSAATNFLIATHHCAHTYIQLYEVNLVAWVICNHQDFNGPQADLRRAQKTLAINALFFL